MTRRCRLNTTVARSICLAIASVIRDHKQVLDISFFPSAIFDGFERLEWDGLTDYSP